MKLEDLLKAAQDSLDAARKEREAIAASQQAMLDKAQAEGRSALSVDEDAEFSKLSERKKEFDAKTIAERSAKVESIRAEIAADADYVKNSQVRTPGVEKPAYDQVGRVGQEKRTYSPDTDKRGKLFLRDVASAFLGDFEAGDRLRRHRSEELVERGSDFQQRAVGTGAFAGLTVPQYLTDMVAKNPAAMRPLADICNHHDLPADGMSVNISRITTATSAAAQSSENAAVSETNIDDTLLTESVLTVAGQQTMSRQSIDRGTGTEEITLDDLIRRYHSALDSKLINDATTGLTNVSQSVAYTDATPTAAELWPKLLNAQANLEAVMLDQGVGNEYAVMHSRRWAWLQSQVGTSWPFISQPGVPTQAGGVNTGGGYGDGVRGVLPNGTRVIVDNNIGTTLGAGTEDEIYFVNSSELHLWEDPNAPVFIRAEQPSAASLGVLLVVYGYFAYSFRRYTNGHQKIAGTGLIAPTF